MFNVGQYLRASVVNVVSGKNASAQLSSSYGAASKRGNEDWKASRRCELTLEPSKVNAGVTFNDLKSGNSGLILQATVKSIEDTGYILDFGINTNKDQSDKSTLTSFLPFKGLKPLRKTGDLPPQALTSGGIISTKTTKIADNGRTCTVSVSPNEIRSSIVSDASVGLSALIPGTLIQGTISSITPSGLNVKFLGFYEGSVDNLHMLPSTAHTYKVGEKIKARILWTAPPLNDSPIRFSLSTLPHILSLTPKTAPIAPGISNSEVAPIGQVLPIGTFLENLQIIKVEPEWGILCALPGTDLKAFVHISHVSDEHITNLSTHATSGLWKVGSIHKGRVIGYSSLDGLLQASLQKSVLERRFMKVQDLHVGEKIDGIVQRLSDSALFVNIHGNVAGVVWPLHYSDLRLKHPERRFKAGTAVKARVSAWSSSTYMSYLVRLSHSFCFLLFLFPRIDPLHRPSKEQSRSYSQTLPRQFRSPPRLYNRRSQAWFDYSRNGTDLHQQRYASRNIWRSTCICARSGSSGSFRREYTEGVQSGPSCQSQTYTCGHGS